jgi:hypothetical protein
VVSGVALLLLGAGLGAGTALAAAGPEATVAGGFGRGSALGVAQQPIALAPDGSGLAVGDLSYMLVRQVDGSGQETTLACDGTTGYGGDGGPAVDARCDGPYGVAVDGSGDTVFSDYLNNRVRVVGAAAGSRWGQALSAGTIVSVAGSGTYGFGGDEGPAAAAQLAAPTGVVLDGSGNLLVADSGNQRVRVVAGATGTFWGQSMTQGDIYTVAGDGTEGSSGDGGPATAAELDQPTALALDPSGNLLIADTSNNEIRVLAASTGTFYGRAMTGGDLYTVAGDGTVGSAGDGGPATAAELNDPTGLAVDGHGNVAVADLTGNRVQVLAASTGTFYGRAMTGGDLYTVTGDGTAGFAGDGGPASAAEVSAPQALAVDQAGNLAVADTGNNRIRVLALSSGTDLGVAMTAGDIYSVAGTGGPGGYSGDGGPATDAELSLPTGVTLDPAGDVIFSDQGNHRVRMVAAQSGTLFGQTLTAGDVTTLAGDGTAGTSGDGGPGPAAELDQPSGLVLDRAGNLVVADAADNVVRVVAATTGTDFGRPMVAGDVYTVAGNGNQGVAPDGSPAATSPVDGPQGITLDRAGNLVVAEFYGARILVVATATGTDFGRPMVAGDAYTVAGTGTDGPAGNPGPALAAQFEHPLGVAVDRFGNLVVSDYGNEDIRVLAAASGTFYGQAMTGGDLYTVAGTGTPGGGGDGGPATAAQLAGPSALGVDATGNILEADSGSGRIRVVAAASGSAYGQAMVTGDIYTVGGGGGGSCLAGGLSATGTALDVPLGLAVSGQDTLTVADTTNECLRQFGGTPEPPGPPTAVGATAGNGQAVVHWAPPALNGGSPVTGYTVTASPGGASVQVGAGATSATVGGLTNGVTYRFNVQATNAQGAGPASVPSTPAQPLPPEGYWLAGRDGAVFSFGTARYYGSLPGLHVAVGDVVGVAPTPDGKGYWLVDAHGGLYAFGDAGYFGSLPGLHVSVTDVVAMASTPDGKGYWMVDAHGGLYAFGDAGYFGSLPGLRVSVGDVVGVAPNPDGKGYWLVDAQGGLYAFGDAGYFGSLPGLHVAVADVVGLVPSADGRGYWLAGRDGSVYGFGDATYRGSLPGLGVAVDDVVGLGASPDGLGYWLVGQDGSVYGFGDGAYQGSVPGTGNRVDDIVGLGPSGAGG